MPNWKKVIVSGSNAVLNNITSSGNISASGTITANVFIGDGSNLSGVTTFSSATVSGSFTSLSSSIASDVATNTAKLTANTSNVTSAGALMDSEVTSLALIKGLTAATISGSISATSVAAAGALMDSEVTSLALIKGLTAATISGSSTSLSSSVASDVATNTAKKTADATNVTSAGALMDSEVTSLALIKSITAATISGSSNSLSSSVASDVATNTAKLTANTSNVTSAGALMDSELSDLAAVKAINQGLTTTSNVTFGGITAASLNVTHLTSSFITSSTIQTEGSNLFGDAINDTQFFNGHITASGNISASGRVYGTHFGTGNANRNAIDFSTNNTLQFRLNDSSRITHTTTIFRPTTDEAVSLGRTANKWKELVVKHITASGNISASGTGTNFLGGDLNFSGDRTISTIGASDSLTINPSAQLFLGTSNADVIEIGRQSGTGTAGRVEIYAHTATPAALFQLSTITFNHPITASGNISASLNSKIFASSASFGGASFLRSFNVKGTDFDGRLSLQGAAGTDNPGIEFTVNDNTSRALIRLDQVGTNGTALEFFTEPDGGDITNTLTIGHTGHITASGNISANGIISGSNLSGINTGDQDLSSYIQNSQTSSFLTSTSTASIANGTVRSLILSSSIDENTSGLSFVKSSVGNAATASVATSIFNGGGASDLYMRLNLTNLQQKVDGSGDPLNVKPNQVIIAYSSGSAHTDNTFKTTFSHVAKNLAGVQNTSFLSYHEGNDAFQVHFPGGLVSASAITSPSQGILTVNGVNKDLNLEPTDNVKFNNLETAGFITASGRLIIKDNSNQGSIFHASASNVVTIHNPGPSKNSLLSYGNVQVGNASNISHITASGNISASGDLFIKSVNLSDSISANHITASGNISSSGTIHGANFKLDGDLIMRPVGGGVYDTILENDGVTIIVGSPNREMAYNGTFITLGGNSNQHTTASGNLRVDGKLIVPNLPSAGHPHSVFYDTSTGEFAYATLSSIPTFKNTGKRIGDSSITGSLAIGTSASIATQLTVGNNIFIKTNGDITASNFKATDNFHITDEFTLGAAGNLQSFTFENIGSQELEIRSADDSVSYVLLDNNNFNPAVDILLNNDKDIKFGNPSHWKLGHNSTGNKLELQEGSTTRFTWGAGGHVTASGNISSSGNLFANVADNSDANFKTVVYDTTTGKFFRTGSYGGGGGADNLGNHTATQDLDLGGNNIKNINNITASGNISASGDIRTSGNIYGDDGTDIFNINQIYCDQVLHDGDTDNGFIFGDDILTYQNAGEEAFVVGKTSTNTYGLVGLGKNGIGFASNTRPYNTLHIKIEPGSTNTHDPFNSGILITRNDTVSTNTNDLLGSIAFASDDPGYDNNTNIKADAGIFAFASEAHDSINNHGAYLTFRTKVIGSDDTADSTEQMKISDDGLTLTVINNASSDTDKFLVSDGGLVKYRSGSQVLDDIGAASTNYTKEVDGGGGISTTDQSLVGGGIKTTVNFDPGGNAGELITSGDTSGGTDLYESHSTLVYDGTDLQVHGGDIIAFYSSDKRLKDNVTPISNPIKKILQIGGYTFDWNEKQDTYKGHDIGVIAQEVEKVLPEVVETRENGYKAVKYQKIVPLLIEAIKDQQKQIDELKKLIENASK